MEKIDVNDIPFVDYRGKCLVESRECGNLVFLSGFGCDNPETPDAGPMWTGAAGSVKTVDEAYEAAQWIAFMHIDCLRRKYRLENVESVVRAFGLIEADDSFADFDAAFDGYSDAMAAVFGDRGKHVRTVMGTRHLPNNQTVEIEAIVKLRG
ncbi:MAG: RidA family protein [Defluviitaleaceae bacterium]|nr:RidA family protein [Defluviitaleaceae bacterium]